MDSKPGSPSRADQSCRCGFSGGEGPHPCHGNRYRCRKPAQQYFYSAKLVGLAGAQMKFEVSETWACEGCWESFKKLLAKHNEKETDDG